MCQIIVISQLDLGNLNGIRIVCICHTANVRFTPKTFAQNYHRLYIFKLRTGVVATFSKPLLMALYYRVRVLNGFVWCSRFILCSHVAKLDLKHNIQIISISCFIPFVFYTRVYKWDVVQWWLVVAMYQKREFLLNHLLPMYRLTICLSKVDRSRRCWMCHVGKVKRASVSLRRGTEWFCILCGS